MTKTNNFIVMNNKGGVGKSTFSQQILTPFNLLNNGEAFIKELDDQNKDAKSLTKSKVNVEQVKVVNEENLREMMQEYAIINPETKNTIIDVGGNYTTTYFIKAVLASPEVLDYVDAVFIPIIDNDISVDNAEDIYNELTKNGELKEIAAKVIFVINNMSYWRFKEAVENNDLEHLNKITKKRYYDAINLFKKTNRPWIPVLQMDGVENTKKAFNSTAIEIFNDSETLTDQANKMMKDSFKLLKGEARNESIEVAARLKTMLFDVTLYTPSILFAHSVLTNVLNAMNEVEVEAKE